MPMASHGNAMVPERQTSSRSGYERHLDGIGQQKEGSITGTYPSDSGQFPVENTLGFFNS